MKKVYIRTYGCAHNAADSEAMAHYLALAGFEVLGFGDPIHSQHPDAADSEQSLLEAADIIIFNTCTVKNPSDDKFFSLLEKINKPVVLAGCIPQSQQREEWLNKYSAVGVEQLESVVEVVQATLDGQVLHKFGRKKRLDPRVFLPVMRKNNFVSIIPILQGCLGACTYCKTKHARGHLQSYPINDIEKQFRQLVNDGAKEIWLTSQDTATYGLDIKTNIVNLLNTLLQKPGDYRIRLGMANPQYILPILDEFIQTLKHPNMFRFVHIPVQVGSNKVLKDMRRGYKVEAFTKAVEKITKEIPDVTIATDIIVGFPTETQDDFIETVSLIKKLNIPVVNISKFYPRPDTVAAKMKLLPTHIVKERSKELKLVCEQIAKERNKSFIGKELSVLIDEEGKKNDTLIARADNYMQVILPKKYAIGERLTVIPTSSGVFDVRVT